MITATLKAKDFIEDFKKKAEKFPKAVNSALNKTGAQAHTYVKKIITDEFNIKKKDLTALFLLRRSNWQTLYITYEAYGRGISLTRFGTKFPTKLSIGPSGKRRYVVKVKIKKAGEAEAAKNVFAIPGKKIFFKDTSQRRSRGTLGRVGRWRKKLLNERIVEKAYGPGPYYMFNDMKKAKVINFMKIKFPTILENDIKFFYD